MPNWEQILDLSEFYNDDSVSIQEKARRIMDMIEHEVMPNFDDDELVNVVLMFEIAEDEDSTEHNFDCAMGSLYDWGDDGHRLWVRTHEGV